MKDKLVITLHEGEELHDGDVIELQKIPDVEYDILDYTNNDVEIDISTAGASAELLVQTDEDILLVAMEVIKIDIRNRPNH